MISNSSNSDVSRGGQGMQRKWSSKSELLAVIRIDTRHHINYVHQLVDCVFQRHAIDFHCWCTCNTRNYFLSSVVVRREICGTPRTKTALSSRKSLRPSPWRRGMDQISSTGQGLRRVFLFFLHKAHSYINFAGSDVVHLKFLGNSLLTLNSVSAANELLDKKGSVYSDRPRLVTLKEL